MTIEIVWRKNTTKQFRGPKDKTILRAKTFCKKLRKDQNAEEIEMFELDRRRGTVAYYDHKFKRIELDG